MGPMLLFTGYRTRDSDLYADEKFEMVKTGVLDGAFLALSRDPIVPRVNFFLPQTVTRNCHFIIYPSIHQTYVQDQLMEEAKLIYRLLSEKKGHFYVCGDSGMAEDVGQTLLLLVQKTGEMNRQESESFIALLRVLLIALINP